jgi:hypothetical protein
MTAATIGTAAAKIIDAGNYDFVHIFNNGSATIYICYDGGEGAAGVNLTTLTGFPIPAQTNIMLTNDGSRNLFRQGIWAISGSPGQDVRIQGV